ncbi:MAG: cytochrome family [Thermoleophilaceae bacterium]|nr:cytochrome family [Thermoleophilaceae bacterium]
MAAPPGPSLPPLVQTLGFVLAPSRFIESSRRRYGDVVTFSTAFESNFVMLFDPEDVKRVFRAPPAEMRAGEANALLGPVLGERSLLLLDGAEHLRQRKLMLPPFHGDRLRGHVDTMRTAADRAIDSWPVGSEFTLIPSMQTLTLEVIMRAVFGVHDAARERELTRRVRAMLDPVARRLGIFVLALTGGRFGRRGAMRRFRERRAELDELLFDEIARRRTAPDLHERGDAFSMLVAARDDEGRQLSDAEIRDELVTLLVAGHETTANGLAWAFDLLLHNPPVLERLKAALADGDPGGYADAVVKETLRVRPVIPGVGRVVRERPFELRGFTIEPGTEINPSIFGIHRRRGAYPDPAAFRPERFLGDGAPDGYSWLPFGGGTRRCIGASFALVEMRTVIARVIERCELRPASAREDKLERRGITLVPKRGVRVTQARAPLPAAPA